MVMFWQDQESESFQNKQLNFIVAVFRHYNFRGFLQHVIPCDRKWCKFSSRFYGTSVEFVPGDYVELGNYKFQQKL
jgi:hypothetical protein